MVRRLQRDGWLLGILGPVIIGTGTAISLWRYEQGGGDVRPFYYWPVSGLGDHNVAPWPMVFNACVVSGALLMGLFLLGVGLRMRHPALWPAVSLGLMGAAGFMGVGIFPSAPETLTAHFIAAGFAFGGAMLSAAAFLAHLLLHAPPYFPRWLAYPSLISVAATAGLVAGIALLVNGAQVQVPAIRVAGVEVSGIILLEWCAFVTLNLWIFLTAWAIRPGLQPVRQSS